MPDLIYKNPDEMTSQEANTGRNMKRNKPTLLIDFDGVIHDYKGWDGNKPTQGPLPNSRKYICALESRYTVVIFTTRPAEFVSKWMLQYGFPKLKITNIKEPAVLILDDRAITFTGQWNDELLERIKNFKAHWELPKSDHLPLDDEPLNSPLPSARP